jgi:hypothetical protein
MNQKSKRGTGRTTRMMEAAIEAASMGRAVYVIVDSKEQGYALTRQYPNTLNLGIKFETFASLLNFDPVTMTLKGAHPHCVVFADHFAIEARYSKLMDELVRYDS